MTLVQLVVNSFIVSATLRWHFCWSPKVPWAIKAISSPSSVVMAASIISWWRSRSVTSSTYLSTRFAPRTFRSLPISSSFSGERPTRKNSTPSLAKHLAVSWAIAEVAPIINILIFFTPSPTYLRDSHAARNWRRSVDQYTGQTLATWGKTPGNSQRSCAHLLPDKRRLRSGPRSYQVHRAIVRSSGHHRQNPGQGLALAAGKKAYPAMVSCQTF